METRRDFLMTNAWLSLMPFMTPSDRRELDKLLAPVASNSLIPKLRDDPSLILKLAGVNPDRWQTDILRQSFDQMMVLASRQSGKSLCSAALALREALLKPESLVLILSVTRDQSAEMFNAKVMWLYNRLGRPLPTRTESKVQVHLSNGSRIIALPAKEASVRGYSSVNLVILDEAARLPDALYSAVTPMQAAIKDGKLIAVSSAWAKQGWFYEAWEEGDDWNKTKITADQCPRISKAFLARERLRKSSSVYDREYNCVFKSSDDAAFDHDSIEAALVEESEYLPLF